MTCNTSLLMCTAEALQRLLSCFVIFSGGGIIGVTEPRRVAAISMSNRVATEMALSTR